MIKISKFCLAIGVIFCYTLPAALYSQDSGLPESWVNPPPDQDDIITYNFEPSPLRPLVSMGSDGKLVYRPYNVKGDRILDWSRVGYMQSSVPIPDAPLRDTLSPLIGETSTDGTMAYPKGPDNGEQIQEALYKVWQMAPDANGLRGAVLLKAGTYYVSGSLSIPSGVVLRGEGSDENGTVIIFRSANGGGSALTMGQGSIGEDWLSAIRISDSYVPTGSYEITVEDAGAFSPGDYIYVRKTVNQKWIDDLGCGERLRHIRGGTEGAGKKPWTPESFQFMHLRKIEEVNGNTIKLDVMMPQSIADEHGGGLVLKADVSSLATHCGVESLCVVSNYDTTVKDTGKGSNFFNFRTGVTINNAMNSWVRDVSVKHMYYSAVSVGDGTLQITVRDSKYLEPVGPYHGGFRYSFSLGGGTGHLAYNCYSEDSRHDFAGGSRTMGPFAFVNSTAVRGGQSEPHHRWGTGFLFDNVKSKDGSIAAINRGDSGSGHGWAAANVTVWNCDAPNIVVFDPETEGENNFAIGYSGDQTSGFGTGGLWYANTRAGYWGTPQEGKYYGYALMGNGHIESPFAPVEPGSLFVQQLIERVGLDQAMRVLDDENEVGPRVHLLGIFSAYPNLEKVNDSTFIMKFNMRVGSFSAGPENFIIRGNSGLEETTFSTSVLNDSTVKLKFSDIGVLDSYTELIVEAKNVTSLTGEPLEGLATAIYMEPDLRPIVNGITATVNNEDGFLEASSTKPGTIYIARFNENYNYLDQYRNVGDLDTAVSSNHGRKVEYAVANTTVEIPTKGLPGGFYLYYAVDEDGRISESADEWPEVIQTGPVMEIVDTIETPDTTDTTSVIRNDALLVPGYSVWSSGETIFIQPNDHSVIYSVRLYDMTGRLLNETENLVGKQELIVPEHRGIMIVKVISRNGTNIGAYKLMHNFSR